MKKPDIIRVQITHSASWYKFGQKHRVYTRITGLWFEVAWKGPVTTGDKVKLIHVNHAKQLPPK